jgi:hypothetical protein
MSFSAADYDAFFAPVVHGLAVKKRLTYLTGAGTPTVTSTKPEFIGQEYLDTSAAMFYKAVTLSSPPVVGDWKLIT